MTDSTPPALAPETPLPPRLLGATGLPVHPVALDGSVFGWAASIDETTEVLDAFAELGGTLISTADHYATGRSEYMIGRWLEQSTRRDELLVAWNPTHEDAAAVESRMLGDFVDGYGVLPFANLRR